MQEKVHVEEKAKSVVKAPPKKVVKPATMNEEVHVQGKASPKPRKTAKVR